MNLDDCNKCGGGPCHRDHSIDERPRCDSCGSFVEVKSWMDEGSSDQETWICHNWRCKKFVP